jgi:enoyl-CoA hydratase/carnithine racemase
LVASTDCEFTMSDLILRADQDGVATLTLNRPEKLNALSKDMFEALEGHIDAIARQTKTVGAVVVRGAHGNFSAGYDMDEVLHYVSSHARPHYHSEVIEKLARLPQPVISAVEGHCSTGALELALAADLIAASESATFCDVYTRWGLTPIWGLTLRLPHRIGVAKASEVLLTSRSYNGREAQAMHLANFCFADASFDAELAALCAAITANSWYANQVTKRALIETDGLTLRQAYGLDLFKNEGLAPDAAKRIAKFRRKDDKT